MGILVSCQSIGKSYSSRPLFKELTFGIEEEQKIGLIGPNGSGKSTLMKILCGLVEADEGNVVSKKQLRTAYVPQDETFDPDKTIEQIVREAGERARWDNDYQLEASLDSTLARLGFVDKDASTATLSGGWKKRLAIACALVQQPELLLLDEPTNHLDLEGVLWLESLLKSIDSFVLISHDRAFLQNVVNRVIELNPTYPQGFLSVKGNYSTFLESREEQLSAQVNLQQALASKVRREIAWLQRGARARQTKARGRIQDAEKLIDDLAEVKQRNALNTAIDIGFDSSGRKTKELLSLKNVAKSFGDKHLFDDLSFVLTPGTKLGLVGQNGSGKTTLLKLIVGQLEPDKGTLKRADQLKVVWFDQNRAQLDKTKTLKESLSSDNDSVVYRGRSMHITTWAKMFLFRPDQLNMPISYLSGGEQARILIANIMLKSADILILDEPTNDLDIPSLEVLEESLDEFPGAIILVTHDRMMLDTLSSQILALDGSGGVEFFADYEQCQQHMDRFKAPGERGGNGNDRKQQRSGGRGRVGFSTAEKRELASIPDKIELAEKKVNALHLEMENPQIATNYPKLQELTRAHQAAQQELEQLFARWQHLEQRAAELAQ